MTRHEKIPGWGADLDPADRPAVPKERMPPRLEGVHWTEPPRQPATVEVLRSTEHQYMPPVFGTSVPPRGISGRIRRRAFRHSENDLRHWLMLLFADRVDVIETLIFGARRNGPTRRAAAAVAIVVFASWWLHRPRG